MALINDQPFQKPNIGQNAQQIGGFLKNVGGLIGNAWNGLQNYNKQSLYQPFDPAAPGGIGLKAKSPTANLSTPTNTLPASQTLGGNNSPPLLSLKNKTTNTGNQTGSGATPVTLTSASIAPDMTQINDLQRQAGALKQYNLTDTNQLTKDQNGNYVPQYPTGQNGVNYNPGNVPTVGSIASQEANLLNNPSPEVQQAQKELADLKNEYAQKGINIQNTAGFLTQAQGEQGLLQNQYLNALDAAQTKVQNALTQQGQGITALGQAGGQIAPQAGNALGYYNPTTNQTTGYNATGGNAFGGGQALGNVAAGQQYQQTLLPAYNAAGGILKNFTSWIDQPGQSGLNGVNPSDANLVNQLKGWAQGQQFSDPRYPQLSQFLNEFMNTLSPVIGAPGEVTNYKQQIVNSLLNPSSSAGSLKQQAQSLYDIASQKMQSIAATGGSSGGSSGSAFSPGANGFFGTP